MGDTIAMNETMIWFAVGYSSILFLLTIIMLIKRVKRLEEMKELGQRMEEHLNNLKRGSNEF